jgi:hypothetical protein
MHNWVDNIRRDESLTGKAFQRDFLVDYKYVDSGLTKILLALIGYGIGRFISPFLNGQ